MADSAPERRVCVFESVHRAWLSYCSLMIHVIPEDDVRHDLAAEVRTRLGQLDIILKHLDDARNAIAPDPQEVEKADIWLRDNYFPFARGEISFEAWCAGTRVPLPAEVPAYIAAWESINLFTDSFYFFAWRLVGALNMEKFPKAERFPELRKIKAPGVNFVRNKLLEHPEQRPLRRENFTQGLVFTDSGPVLRATGATIRSATGEVLPAGDSGTKDFM